MALLAPDAPLGWGLTGIGLLLVHALLAGCDSDPAGPGTDPPPEEIELAFVWEDESANQTFTVLYDRAGRNFFYVVNREAGLLVYDASDPDEPELVHIVPGTAFGGRYTNNLTQVGTLLYVATGNFMALPQQTPGLAIVDVSNPTAAFVRDTWEHGAGTRGAHDVAVRGDYAYLGASLEGLLVLDVSNPGDITFVSQLVPNPDFPTPNPGIFQTPAARGLAVVNDDLLLLTYGAGGFRTIDISNPAAPEEIGAYINGAISPQVQAQAYNNVVVEGTTAYVPPSRIASSSRPETRSSWSSTSPTRRPRSSRLLMGRRATIARPGGSTRRAAMSTSHTSSRPGSPSRATGPESSFFPTEEGSRNLTHALSRSPGRAFRAKKRSHGGNQEARCRPAPHALQSHSRFSSSLPLRARSLPPVKRRIHLMPPATRR